MNLLLNNPIGSMYGPHFLVMYLILSCLVIGLALYVRKRMRQNTAPMGIPAPPERDPYALAFLREGHDEVIRLAFVSLVQKGRLEVVETRKWYGNRLNLVCARNPGTDPLSELEQEVLRTIGESGPSSGLNCQPVLLRKAVDDFCDRFQRQLEGESLLAPADQQWAAFLKMLPFAVVLVGLAVYKLSVAFSKGHTNVLGLMIACLAALIILWAICRPRRLTALGEQYLEGLQSKKKGSVLHDLDSPVSADSFLLAVSVLGLSVLENTTYESVKSFHWRPITAWIFKNRAVSRGKRRADAPVSLRFLPK